MHYLVTADTDVGIVKNTNQDSLCVKVADINSDEALMAIICDGMGGLAKGELASATVIRAFSDWFDYEFHKEIELADMSVIAAKWELMLKELNVKIMEYGKKQQVNLGTTFTGFLCLKNKYLIVHVGDTRAYYIGDELDQLTEDQTFVAREIQRGNMTAEEAKTDHRRNVLLQCIGASKSVDPQVIMGYVEKGLYMLCSDGFRHEISKQEIYDTYDYEMLDSKEMMHAKSLELISTVKARNEKDNISVVLIKAV